MSGSFSDIFNALIRLTERNVKVFIKDRANVFFSMLAPLIVLVAFPRMLGRKEAIMRTPPNDSSDPTRTNVRTPAGPSASW